MNSPNLSNTKQLILIFKLIFLFIKTNWKQLLIGTVFTSIIIISTAYLVFQIIKKDLNMTNEMRDILTNINNK